jgi:ankyrin repeat protein
MKRYFVFLAPFCLLLLSAFSAHASWDFIHQYSSKNNATQIVVDYLGFYPAALNSKDSDGKTPLMWAAWNMRLSTVEALLKMGAKVDEVDHHGNSALIFAAGPFGGSDDPIKVQIINLLLAKGALANHANAKGDTALHSAVQFGFAEVVKALLAGGADVGVSNEENTTPCSYAKQYRQDLVPLLECPHCHRPMQAQIATILAPDNQTAGY